MDKRKIVEYFTAGFDKYKYILMVCLVGLALTCFPSAAKDKAPQAASDMSEDTGILEERLEDILSQMSGAGRVKVMLTAKGSSRSLYAYNEDKSISRSDGSQTSDIRSSLVCTGGSSSQQPVAVGTDGPEYRGALIVCDGADDPHIRLEMTQAVTSLTGIGADSIVISKMK